MSIYKSKPKIIEAIEFDPLKPFELPAELMFRKRSQFVAKVQHPKTEDDVEDVGTYEIYNRLHNSWVGIKPGDMIRIDQPNDHYPIDKAYFEENYLPVEC